MAMESAIADAGAAGNLFLPGVPIIELKEVSNPITTHLPNIDTLCTAYTCMLDMLWLPDKVRKAHLVPSLTHSSLILIKMPCNAGCKVA